MKNGFKHEMKTEQMKKRKHENIIPAQTHADTLTPDHKIMGRHETSRNGHTVACIIKDRAT